MNAKGMAWLQAALCSSLMVLPDRLRHSFRPSDTAHSYHERLKPVHMGSSTTGANLLGLLTEVVVTDWVSTATSPKLVPKMLVVSPLVRADA